jgi:hypothetical protein
MVGGAGPSRRCRTWSPRHPSTPASCAPTSRSSSRGCMRRPSSAVWAGLAIRDFAGPGGQAMISASTPGCVASQAPRQVRIWSSACGSVAAPGRSTLYGVATALGTNQAPKLGRSRGDRGKGGVAESDPGLGGQARLALGRAYRVDTRELNLDRDGAARPAALSRALRAQAAWHLARAAVEDHDRAVKPPALASRPHRRHRDQPDAPPELDELGRGRLTGGVGDRVGDRWSRTGRAPVEQRLEGEEFCRRRV